MLNNDFISFDEAYLLLKEGIKLNDSSNSLFYKKGKFIKVTSSNASYLLNKEDFLKLYEKTGFFIYEDKETGIDTKKDEEYYSFKHK